MSLKDEWDRLDSETRTWLLENPGCLVVPRAMSDKIVKDAHGDLACDPHGQVVLSRDDHDFIREKRRQPEPSVSRLQPNTSSSTRRPCL